MNCCRLLDYFIVFAAIVIAIEINAIQSAPSNASKSSTIVNISTKPTDSKFNFTDDQTNLNGEKDDQFIITTSLGKIRGRYQKYHSGEPGGYYSFQGIRYGLAPIGDRRFYAAEPEEPWTGILDASREGHICPQKTIFFNTFDGNEDCLFLNVFISEMPMGELNPKFPVMVWIHGGGFSSGSGDVSLFGPDYLVAAGIVLVTINYRLGALGFLTAGPNAPGNQGLKDQVLALKWVQDNIAAFGGDPNQVTIFGVSAGAASVQLLLLSPLSVGLFQRAISQSGSVLNPWSISEASTELAYRLAVNLSYVGANVADDILEFLRPVPPIKLVEAASALLTAEDYGNNIFLPFVPVTEGYWNKDGRKEETFYEEPFMTDHPTNIYREHNFHKNVSYMIGYNSNEALLFIGAAHEHKEMFKIIQDNFESLLTHDLNITSDKAAAAKEIKEFYLGSKQVGPESIKEMIPLISDLMFLQGIRKSARYHAKYGNAPVYMYRFSFEGALGVLKTMLGITEPGVCHGDELGYLFKFGLFNINEDPKSLEIIVKNRMVKMWTNFAKYGTPTPQVLEDSLLLNTNWEPINPNTIMDNLNYLEISSSLDMKSNPEPERQYFWDNIYTKYNGQAI